MLAEGTKAPLFTLDDQNGNNVSLSDFRGQKVVLYFYPKDNTPGCTKEACSIRDSMPDFSRLNVKILGVSRDSGESHRKFIEKQNLNFTLLSDPGHQVMEEYGAWGEKTLYGKKSMGVIRSTFVINEDGVIEKVYKKVNTATHGEDLKKYFAAAGMKAT